MSLIGKVKDWADFAIYAPYSILMHLRIQLLIVGSMFAFGTAIFMYYQGLDPLTALLGSVSTITTIGIYTPNIIIMPQPEKILLIFTFLMSVGSAASIVQGIVSTTLNKEEIVSEYSLKKVKASKGHVIVMGYKFLGKYVVEDLKKLGLEFIVLVKDDVDMATLKSQGIPSIVMPPTHFHEGLMEAGISKASTLIATFDDDGDNMLSILSAKKLNKNIRTIMILNDKELTEGAKYAGADVVVPIFEVASRILAFSSISEGVAGVLITDRLKNMHLAEFEVPAQVSYREIKGASPVIAVYHDGLVKEDISDDFQLEKGDYVYLLSEPTGIMGFKERLDSLLH